MEGVELRLVGGCSWSEHICRFAVSFRLLVLIDKTGGRVEVGFLFEYRSFCALIGFLAFFFFMKDCGGGATLVEVRLVLVRWR